MCIRDSVYVLEKAASQLPDDAEATKQALVEQLADAQRQLAPECQELLANWDRDCEALRAEHSVFQVRKREVKV